MLVQVMTVGFGGADANRPWSELKSVQQCKECDAVRSGNCGEIM